MNARERGPDKVVVVVVVVVFVAMEAQHTERMKDRKRSICLSAQLGTWPDDVAYA